MGKSTSGKSRKSNVASTKVSKVKTEVGIEQPTPEQAARVRFDLQAVLTEMGQVVGRAYRRQPLYRSMAKQMKISRDQLDALDFYRSAFDRSERSATKSCLNVGVGGGGKSSGDYIPVEFTPSIAEARRKVALCERPLGALLAVMRAVVLEDLSFSEIAMARYGSRKRDWIDVDVPVIRDGKPLKVKGKVVKEARTVERLAPRSPRHREIIAQEFRDGLRILTVQHQLLGSRSAIEEIWIQPEADGTATIHRGVSAPNGLYRVWGGRTMVAKVFVELGEEHSDLTFPTPFAAKHALDEAAGGRLIGLMESELAA
ncbi:hypothetical protein [uncultured Sphingomonas sp.]|uniref:hypothetical protein n=1 Tax=uncultured Sphingomonas sp. TaxID=158754 RepID=UPI00260F6BA0|nr:hypothetical protein [uncultured Sphingomonas sp.]